MAERMTGGGSAGPVGPTEGDYDAPPDDTAAAELAEDRESLP